MKLDKLPQAGALGRLAVVATLATGCAHPAPANGEVAAPELTCADEQDCYFRTRMKECMSRNVHPSEKTEEYCSVELHKEFERDRGEERRKEERRALIESATSPEMAYFNSKVVECSRRWSRSLAHCQREVYEEVLKECQRKPDLMAKICEKITP